MELSEIILASVGALSTISAWVVKNLATDLKKLDEKLSNCQIDMHDRFVQKSEFQADMAELKAELRAQSTKIDQIWKHMRVGNGKN